MTASDNAIQVREVDAATARKWLDGGEAVLIDVREPDEHARERIRAAKLVPLSRFDPGAVPMERGLRVLLHCRSGHRSLEAAAQLACMPEVEVFSIRGGIEAWKKGGHPVVENRKAPISIIRQVQIAAGSLVLLGVILGAFVSPWWLLLSGFVGAGLTFAGISGMCGMAVLLAKLPWNRIEVQGGPEAGASA